MEYLIAFFQALWSLLVASSTALLLGLLIAGIVHQFLKKELLNKLIGRNKWTDALWGSLIGAPLPLCSCSVIPTSISLKEKGASNAGTSAFLISTPETGVDSVLLTLSLMNPWFAGIRVVCAVASGFFAGIFNLLWNRSDANSDTSSDMNSETSSDGQEPSKPCCASKNSSSKAPLDSEHVQSNSLIKGSWNVIHYGFKTLLDDISDWLLVGFLLGALLDILVPPFFFTGYSSLVSKLLALGIGIPVYICAAASTPLAATLMLKGLSPGAALILLTVGPATNMMNLLVLKKYIGNRGIFINILTVSLISFSIGVLMDSSDFFVNLPLGIVENQHDHSSGFELILTIFFTVLLVMSVIRNRLKHSHSSR